MTTRRGGGAIAIAVTAAIAGIGAIDCGGSADRAGQGAAATPAPPPYCKQGRPSGYPTRGNDLLPAMELRTVDLPGVLSTKSYFDPCGERSSLLVIRLGAPWCGTCRWHAAHTAEVKALDVGDRLRFLDIVITDRDNARWGPWYNSGWGDMQRDWRAAIDAPDDVAAEETWTLFQLVRDRPRLPVYILVDRRTMQVRATLEDPSPEHLHDGLRRALAKGDELPAPAAEIPALIDGRFDREQWEMIRAMADHAPPPPDPTNEYADDPAAAELGKAFFFDGELSPGGRSCATCHDPAKGLADGLAQSVGAGPGTRNAPALTFAAHQRWQFWDGAADSLWMQAAKPFENDRELASSRVWVAHRVVDYYPGGYAQVFRKYPLPDMSDVPRSPAPWRELASKVAGKTESITRVLVNVAKAIAAFERTLSLEEEPLDRYARGDTTALSDAEKDGLAAFLRSG